MRQHIRQDGTPYHETAQRQREHLHATTAGVNQLIATDLATYLPDELCVKVGIAAKASGLEMRSPLLDHKIAEFAASLPPELKLNGGQPKYILKRLVERMVPDADVWRAKRGFGIPLAEWLRGELREMAQDTLTSSSMQQRGLFDGPAVQQLLREHASGLHDHARKIWRLLMLELWLRRHAGVTYVRG
jgi:asparagine synthase (glutamine-hydrolysing)